MINSTLYIREMKKSVKMLLIFAAVITMYVIIIIGMYDPKTMDMLDGFYDMMPQLMAAVGMKQSTTNLLGFMVSYLYGFIFLIFPMIYTIIRANGLVSKYTDSGAMAVLLASPIKKISIVFTQMTVLLSGIVLLLVYSTGLELIAANCMFPGELETMDLIKLNLSLLCLHFFVAGICFFCSCIFSETRYSLAFGAGIPIFMYVLQMLANVGGKAENAKYFTFFSLFDSNKIAVNETGAFGGIFILFVGAVVLLFFSCFLFCRKDINV